MNARAVVAVGALAVGCGRVRFFDHADAGAGADATPPPGDACAFGPFGPVREIAEVDSTANDDGPWLSDDRTSLVFTSDRSGDQVIYAAQRVSASDPFDPPVAIGLAGVTDDADPFETRDHLQLWFDSTSGASTNIFVATRATPTDAFGTPQAVAQLDLGTAQYDPSMTDDQLTITFDSVATGQLYVAQRASVADPFGTPQALTAVTGFACCPAFDVDKDTIVYTGRPDTDYTLQVTAFGPAGYSAPATFAPELYVAGFDEADPYLTGDGRTIVFASTRNSGGLTGDLFIADRTCQ